jgi:DNA-binding transcriptional MerR regulator
MTSRTYLSIGDVLTLLREEFPDVTISKIRFLESQGLVNPERSPSGYRKFFDTDVERLRWVLRQQREHFLPLKVIRDRLADGDLSEDEAAQPAAHATARRNGRAAQSAHVAGAENGASGGGAAGAGGAGHAVGRGNTATVERSPGQVARTEEQSTQAGDEAMARILADATRRSARIPGTAGERHDLHAVPDPAAPAPPFALRAPAAAGLAPEVHSAFAGGSAASDVVPIEAVVDAVAVGDHRVDAPVDPAPSAAGPPSSVPDVRSAAHASRPSGSPSSRGGTSAPAARPSREPRHLAPPAADVTVPSANAGGSGSSDGLSGSGLARGGSARPAETARSGATERSAERSTEPAAVARGRGAGAGTGKVPGPSHDLTAPASGGVPASASAATVSASASMVTGASLTAEELCAASGLSEVELASLQGFGLVEPEMVAGIPTFDEDALTVANLAAAFRKFGIEARHLRLYRNAVDREMGLIEQVIIPLLRQRNPESRQRAVEGADELVGLGQTMRATLMRTALRRHVGG